MATILYHQPRSATAVEDDLPMGLHDSLVGDLANIWRF